MTEAELERWILEARWGPERLSVFDIHEAICLCSFLPRSDRQVAEVMIVARSLGKRTEVADAWIAATALLYDALLVTNNPTDYMGVLGLKLAPKAEDVRSVDTERKSAAPSPDQLRAFAAVRVLIGIARSSRRRFNAVPIRRTIAIVWPW